MYTMQERTLAQSKTFELKKQGYKVTRIIQKSTVGYDKNKQPIFEEKLVSFGYSKDKLPKEIYQHDIAKYDFIFIYEN